MTYDPPPDADASAPQPDPAPSGPHAAYYGTMQQQGASPRPHPRHPGTNPDNPGWSGGPSAAGRPKGSGLAVAALILGLLGFATLLLPLDFHDVTTRPRLAILFALPGLVLGVCGGGQRRRGKPLAVTGAILSGLALVLGANLLLGLF